MTAAVQEKKVLIAVDGNEHSEKAFDYYVDYFHQPMNRVIVLHSPEQSNITKRMTKKEQAPYKRWEEMKAEEEKKWQILRDKYEKKLKQYNVPGSVVIVPSNNPGEAIIEYANHDDITMIITGTRGLGMIGRKLMGSVSEHVIHNAHCPVIVYRT